MRRRSPISLLASGAVAAVALLATGCGSEDFPNEPRPPAPIELTAKVDEQKVIISPKKDANGDPIGAGLATITVANLTDEDGVQLVLRGPTENASDPIVSGGAADLKLSLEEGEYEVEAEGVDVREATLEVGPERPSSQNELLLP